MRLNSFSTTLADTVPPPVRYAVTVSVAVGLLLSSPTIGACSTPVSASTVTLKSLADTSHLMSEKLFAIDGSTLHW